MASRYLSSMQARRDLAGACLFLLSANLTLVVRAQCWTAAAICDGPCPLVAGLLAITAASGCFSLCRYYARACASPIDWHVLKIVQALGTERAHGALAREYSLVLKAYEQEASGKEEAAATSGEEEATSEEEASGEEEAEASGEEEAKARGEEAEVCGMVDTLVARMLAREESMLAQEASMRASDPAAKNAAPGARS